MRKWPQEPTLIGTAIGTAAQGAQGAPVRSKHATKHQFLQRRYELLQDGVVLRQQQPMRTPKG